MRGVILRAPKPFSWGVAKADTRRGTRQAAPNYSSMNVGLDQDSPASCCEANTIVYMCTSCLGQCVVDTYNAAELAFGFRTARVALSPSFARERSVSSKPGVQRLPACVFTAVVDDNLAENINGKHQTAVWQETTT